MKSKVKELLFLSLIIYSLSSLCTTCKIEHYIIVRLYIPGSDELSGVIIGIEDQNLENLKKLYIATSRKKLNKVITDDDNKIKYLNMAHRDVLLYIADNAVFELYDDITLVDSNKVNYEAVAILSIVIDISSNTNFYLIKQEVQKRLAEGKKLAEHISTYKDARKEFQNKKKYITSGYCESEPECKNIDKQHVREISLDTISFDTGNKKPLLPDSFHGGGIFVDKTFIAVLYNIKPNYSDAMLYSHIAKYRPPFDDVSPTPGCIWMKPYEVRKEIDTQFETDIFINSGNKMLYSYDFEIYYGSGICIDTEKTRGISGIKSEIHNPQVSYTEGKKKSLRITGKFENGYDAGENIKLFTIYWKAFTPGTEKLKITVHEFIDINKESIGEPEGLFDHGEVIGTITIDDKNGTPTPVPQDYDTPYFTIESEETNISIDSDFNIKVYYRSQNMYLKEFTVKLFYDSSFFEVISHNYNLGIIHGDSWNITDARFSDSNFNSKFILISGENISQPIINTETHLFDITFKGIKRGHTEILLKPENMKYAHATTNKLPEKVKQKFSIENLSGDSDSSQYRFYYDPSEFKVKKDEEFETRVYIDIGNNDITEYEIAITYEKNIELLTDKMNSGVIPGENGFITEVIPLKDISSLEINGDSDHATESKGQSPFLTIKWRAIQIGQTKISIIVLNVKDKDNKDIKDILGETVHVEVFELKSTPVPTDEGEVGSGEVGSGEVGSGEVGSGEVGSGEVGSGEVGSGEVGSGDERHGNAGEIGILQFDESEIIVDLDKNPTFTTSILLNIGEKKMNNYEILLTFPEDIIINNEKKNHSIIDELSTHGKLEIIDEHQDNRNIQKRFMWESNDKLGISQNSERMQLLFLRWKALNIGIYTIALEAIKLIDETGKTIRTNKINQAKCKITVINDQFSSKPPFDPTDIPSIMIIDPTNGCRIKKGKETELRIYCITKLPVKDSDTMMIQLNNDRKIEKNMHYITDEFDCIENYLYTTISNFQETGEITIQVSIEMNNNLYTSNSVSIFVEEEEAQINSESYNRKRKSAFRDMEDNKFNSAIDSFKTTREIFSADADIALALAECYYYQAELEKAHRILDEMPLYHFSRYEPSITTYEDIIEEKHLLLYKIYNLYAMEEKSPLRKNEYYSSANLHLLFLFNHSKSKNEYYGINEVFLLSIGYIIKNYLKTNRIGEALSIDNNIRKTLNYIDDYTDKLGGLVYLLNRARLYYYTDSLTSPDIIAVIEDCLNKIENSTYFNTMINELDADLFKLGYYSFKIKFYKKINNKNEAEKAKDNYNIIKSMLVEKEIPGFMDVY